MKPKIFFFEKKKWKARRCISISQINDLPLIRDTAVRGNLNAWGLGDYLLLATCGVPTYYLFIDIGRWMRHLSRPPSRTSRLDRHLVILQEMSFVHSRENSGAVQLMRITSRYQVPTPYLPLPGR